MPANLTGRTPIDKAFHLVAICMLAHALCFGQSSSDWPEFHNTNMLRSNPSEALLSVSNVAKLQLKWSYPIGRTDGSPIEANGAVYIGADNGIWYSLNAGTGALLWSYQTATGPCCTGPTAAVANGVVFFGSLDGLMYARNATTDAKLWSYDTGNVGPTSPAVANGVVYVNSSNNNLYALNASTGALLWNYSGSVGWSSPAVANGVVYAVSGDNGAYNTQGNVYALDASTGVVLWSQSIGAGYPQGSSPAVADGMVYVGSGDGNVYALNATTGDKLWNYTTENGNNVGGSPAVANGVVYVGNYSGAMYALNASTGEELWSYQTPTGTYAISSSPVVANGWVYVASTDGNLYAFGLPAVGTFTTLVNFDGADGSFPHYGYLVQATDGDLYGMTGGGGTEDCGTIFKMTPLGVLTTVSNFHGASDGCNPDGGLMLATGGDIYGSTTNAGDSGGGTLFRVSPEGVLTTVHQFDYTNGGNTNSALLEAPDGLFYGTTVNGGHSISCCDGGGVIFQMTPAGVYSALHFFDFSDGWDPQDATLVQGKDGLFYGETAGGGSSSNCSNNCGTIFKVGPLGSYTVLHNFDGTDGYAPLGGLIQATDGNFYGTTYYGGARGNGTVFRMSLDGALTTLHNFGGPDGAQPRGRLIQATDGNLYGTTYAGGANGDGTIFQITLGGKLTTLHSFDGTSGAQITSGLSQDTNGIFYGITSGGGTSGNGTLFSLSTGLPPFVAFILDSGAVGQTAEILGQGLTGTTGVSFNGTPAVFNVISDSYLSATVPVGATTGFLTMTTPGGTLESNKQFRVIPQIKSFSPTSGPVGTTVVITGESFTQATGAELACKWPMKFTVDSDTQITATIPPNGTTGGIMIFTAGGHAESTAQFTVVP